MSGQTLATAPNRLDRVIARLAAQHPSSWTTSYLRQASAVDAVCALAGGLLAFQVRFDGERSGLPGAYLMLSLILPLLWVLYRAR